MTLKEAKENRKPRIRFCGYSLTGNDNTPVNLCASKDRNIFFNGIANCGGYWRCPVCAFKIAEEKKRFLMDLILAHQQKGGSIGFLTLTVRHNRLQPLRKPLNTLLENYRAFQRTSVFQRERKSMGFLGQVKTLELTYSQSNGWHPHLHILYFYDNENVKDIEKWQKQVLKEWAKYKDNKGLVKAQNQQVLKPDHKLLAEYLAKYDIVKEMTKGQLKSSKGLTPFTALAKLSCEDYDSHEQKRLLYGVYSEYVEQTQGKHYVNISNSLRKLYPEIFENEKTDEEIVNEVEIDEILLQISVDVWRKIAKNDLQPLVLNAYRQNQLDGVVNLLTYFKDFEGLEVEILKETPILNLYPNETN